MLKKYTLWGTLVFLLLSLIGAALPFADAWYWENAKDRLLTHYTPIMEHMAQEGPTQDLQERLLSHPLPSSITAVFISRFGPGEPRIIASYPEQFLGTSPDAWRILGNPGHRITPYSRIFQGAGDAPYQLMLLVQRPTWITPFGLALFVGGLLLAWLSIALWIYLDARDRAPGAAPAWLLLGLLAGPVALAVWLISRGARPDAPATGICPGCGGDTPADAIFCPHCRFALRPSCPSCNRPAQTTWTYCPTCGSDLVDPHE